MARRRTATTGVNLAELSPEQLDQLQRELTEMVSGARAAGAAALRARGPIARGHSSHYDENAPVLAAATLPGDE